MKDYPNKSFEYVIPNAKALKKWLIFEKFHFFTEISPFFEISILLKHEKMTNT